MGKLDIARIAFLETVLKEMEENPGSISSEVIKGAAGMALRTIRAQAEEIARLEKEDI